MASLPELLRARVSAPFDNEIWSDRFAADSDQSVVQTPEGRVVVVTAHGGGIFRSPERVDKAFRMDVQSMTGCYAGKLSEQEERDLLSGKLPDGSEIPVFSYDTFKTGVPDLPRRYAVILDYETAVKSPRGHVELDALRNDPYFITLVGGVAEAAAYLDKVGERQATLGNWPPFNVVYCREAQSRILFLSKEGGVLASNGLVNMARYVAIAPRRTAASLRHLSFCDAMP